VLPVWTDSGAGPRTGKRTANDRSAYRTRGSSEWRARRAPAFIARMTACPGREGLRAQKIQVVDVEHVAVSAGQPAALPRLQLGVELRPTDVEHRGQDALRGRQDDIGGSAVPLIRAQARKQVARQPRFEPVQADA